MFQIPLSYDSHNFYAHILLKKKNFNIFFIFLQYFIKYYLVRGWSKPLDGDLPY